MEIEEYFSSKTYKVTDQIRRLQAQLAEAEAYQRSVPGYAATQGGHASAYSWWEDRGGNLCVRWFTDDSPGDTPSGKPVWRYSHSADGKLIAEKLSD